MVDIFKLVGTIAINNSLANKEIDETTNKAEQAEGKMSRAFTKVGKAVLKVSAAAAGAAVTAVTALTKSSVEAYAQYEQLVGGVDTLFKESSAKVQKYAAEAYKTAGLSANEYMDTVTSFSASLLQSLGNDTAKAADYADQAIIDMSDNANKMGTAMESIQNAYQGFAKQNYTMLDNLKLGYGGTKEEMERLLADAEKISGIHYDISSFADITQAIHVVQEELGITGTTAEEAAVTIEGSVNSMKSAWANLKVGIADDNANLSELVNQFADSVVTAGENLIPRIMQAIKGIGTVAEKLMPVIVKQLPSVLNEMIPSLVQSVISMIKSVVSAVSSNMPASFDVLIDKILDFLLNLSGKIRENVGTIVDSGMKVILALGKGIANSLPALIEKGPVIVSNLANTINDNAPKLINTALTLIGTLALGLIKAIPVLIKNLPQIIKAIVDVLLAYNWLKLGKTLISKLADGIKSMTSVAKDAGKKIFDNIVNVIKELPSKLYSLAKQAIEKMINIFKHTTNVKNAVNAIKNEIVLILQKLPSQMLSIGKNIVQGLWNGISNAKQWVISKIKGFGQSILDSLKSIFKIHSPSKATEEDGKNLALGVAVGIEKNTKYAKASAQELGQAILDAAQEKLENYKVYNDMMLAEEVAYWNEVRKHCKKGTQARIDADKQYYEAKEELNEQLLAAEEAYQDALDETYKKIEDRTSEILDSFQLFDEYLVGDSVEGSSLIYNLQSQVDALDSWVTEINTLKSRLGDTELFDAIEQMGVDSLAQVKALNSMSASELQQYVDLYNKREELAKKQAETDLADEIMSDMQEAYETYKSTLDSLGVEVDIKYSYVYESIKTYMEDSSKITSDSIDDIYDAFKNGFTDAEDEVNKTMSNIVHTIKAKLAAAVAAAQAAAAEIAAAMSGSEVSGTAAVTTTSTAKVSAHAEGGILTKPTLFGYTPSTGTWHLGGEAGDEAIAPIDKLQGYVVQAVAAQNGPMIEILLQILSAILNKDTSISIDGKEVAKVVNRVLGGAY